MITEKEFEQIKVVCEIACLHPSSFDEHAKVVSVKDILTYIETLVEKPITSIGPIPREFVSPTRVTAQQATGVCPK